MTLPHPKSRKEHDRKEDKPGSGGVIGDLVKWAIDITDYRDAADDVNPAKDRTLCRITHDYFVLRLSAMPRHLILFAA
jgi:hypothetical protein